VAPHNVADLDRRLGQIDTVMEEAAERGKTSAALSAIEGQRKARAGLVDERKREAGALAALQAERATVARRAGKSRRKQRRLGTSPRSLVSRIKRRQSGG
jgi:hypothetical protein